MTLELILNVGFALAVTCVTGGAFLVREPNRGVRRLLVAGLVLHVFGGIAYFALLESAYGGGDYSLYLEEGRRAVAGLLDRSVLPYSPVNAHGQWAGTAAVSVLTSWLMLGVGTHPIPIFILFATVGFAACAVFGIAFQRAFPTVDPRSYYFWVMLYPSLWFWASPVGKDGPVLFGIALALLGVVGRGRKRNFWLIVGGVAMAFAFRPQYAIVLVASIVFGVVVGGRAHLSPLRRVATVLTIVVGVVLALDVVNEMIGFDVTDLEAITRFVESRGENSAYGGSQYQVASNPISGAITTLFRPFPWEAEGALMLVSSVEVVGLWTLVLWRRAAVIAFVKQYGRTEVFWISVAFVGLLAAAAGMAVGNFGTIVRQRVHLYPFLFLIVAGYPQVWRRRAVIRRGELLTSVRP